MSATFCEQKHDWKALYHGRWGHSNGRELIALDWLNYVLGHETEPNGHGALSAELLDSYHLSEDDKYDLYSPDLRLYFEVTGTDFTRWQSEKRYELKEGMKQAVMTVLKAKVDYAERHGFDQCLWFVSVAGMEGNIRFLPCPEVKRFPLTYEYAKGEGAYYKVPWECWWTPARANARFLERRVKLGLV